MNVFEAWDCPSMRIARGMPHGFFQLPHHIVAQKVFDFFCIIVDMVRGDVGGVCEVKLPEPVVSHHGACLLPTGGREKDLVALLVQGHEAVPFKFTDLGGRHIQCLATALRQFTQGDAFLGSGLAVFQHMKKGLESILPLNPL